MTPTEQRIAIAEACGWTGIIAGAIGAVGFPPGRAEAGERRTVIPAYLDDRDAIAEAILTITDKIQQHAFMERLTQLINSAHRNEFRFLGATVWHYATATPKQLSEAFLASFTKEEP